MREESFLKKSGLKDKVVVSGKIAKLEKVEKGGDKESPYVSVVLLGGINEIGKNMTVIEYGDDMFIIDCGLMFPDMDMPGVDVVIPDFSYVVKKKHKLRGVVLTHGHEDHIGALSYFLKNVNVPVYGTQLTISLVKAKLKEAGILRTANLNVKRAGDRIRLGCFLVTLIHVNHSIPDACALAVSTPIGVLFHTGDYKVDFTPIEGSAIDLSELGELGRRGVLLLLADSTNAEKPGFSPSEQVVGSSFERLFKSATDKRILVATFASNVHRIQQVITTAEEHNRKVAVSGRGMVNVIAIAIELGYLKPNPGTMIDIDEANKCPPGQIVIVTTGSQGEPLSALRRISNKEHKKIEVSQNDFIIISAQPIPGNEKFVNRVINDLMLLGADVVYEKMHDTHVSGHAYQDEQKLFINLLQPKYFVPVHGEYRHLKKNAKIARLMGLNPDNILVPELGREILVGRQEIKYGKVVPSGNVMVDGLGVGDVGSVVLRERKLLSGDGLIVVIVVMEKDFMNVLAGPDIISRGFVYVRESEELIERARGLVKEVLKDCKVKNVKDWGNMKNRIKEKLSEFFYKKTQRSPMILPIIEEVSVGATD
ncbi:MAG: ribonuclease J [Oscillospiraceae bacterium]|jgi:ribonuclease J|nr:ribonuclease J [Oscillospiraceae bacterium]